MLSAQQRASQRGTQTKEAAFAPVVVLLRNVMVLMLQYDATKTTIVPYKIYNLGHFAQTGVDFGFNSQMYYGHKRAYEQSGGLVRVVAMPIPAPVGGAASTGDVLTITGTATKAGELVWRHHDVRFSVAVPVGMTASAAGDAVATALTADSEIMLDTIVNTAGVVSAAATFLGSTGDEIRTTGPEDTESQTPEGLTVVYGALTNGAGDETPLQAAWDAHITDPEWKTDVITPSATTAALDRALENIGLPDDGTNKGTGLWSDDDYRPCTNWTANIGDYTTATTPAVNRELDPDNIITAAPDRAELPFAIAIYAAIRSMGLWDSNPAAAPRYLSSRLSAAVNAANDWTRGANGNIAANNALIAGVATIRTDSSGNSILGDMVTTYRPASVPYPTWQFENNKRKSWNIGKSAVDSKLNNPGGVFVQNKAEAPDQPLAVDEDTYKARVVALAILWARYGLIFNAAFTTTNMRVEFSSNPDRIDRYIPVILSGNARVESDTIYIDRNTQIADEVIVLNVG